MAFMTGVGRLPCTDAPSPIPRLTSPDAHMSHSLSISLWELAAWVPQDVPAQHGSADKDMHTQCPGGTGPHSHCGPSAHALPDTWPSAEPLLPGPMRSAASSELSAPWFKGREALSGSQREASGRGPHSHQSCTHPPPLPSSSSLRHPEVPDFISSPFAQNAPLDVEGRHHWSSFQVPDWNTHA